MNNFMSAFKRWFLDLGQTWDRFWFTPSAPHTLALLRIGGGAMLLYTHLIWSLDLQSFLGKDSWLTADVSRTVHQYHGSYVWSYLWYVESPAMLWALHAAAIAVFVMLTLGLFTRVVSVLACVITLSYCHRLNGALFGLDQVNAMLAMYLMIGASGDVFSVDHWRQGRAGGHQPVQPAIRSNIAIRLLQLHLCVVYLFGGIGKMRGEMWWDGSAVWYAIANYEYQSLDLTWLGRWPVAIALLTHITVLWETFYCALVWNRMTRPIALGVAVCVHAGIAFGLGMVTFGIAMIIVNAAFLSPQTAQSLVNTVSRLFWKGRAGETVRAPVAGGHRQDRATFSSRNEMSR